MHINVRNVTLMCMKTEEQRRLAGEHFKKRKKDDDWLITRGK
jgi:hypothetical protein